MTYLMKLVEILSEYNLVPNTLIDSNYCLEKLEDRWIIKYETDRGLFLSFMTEMGSLKMVIPIRLYSKDIPLDVLVNILEFNGILEGSLTKSNLNDSIGLNYEREIPSNRLTEHPQDICQIFKIMRKEIAGIEQFIYSSNDIDMDSGMETTIERLEKTLKEKKDEGHDY